MKGTARAYSQWCCDSVVWWQMAAALVGSTAHRPVESLCCTPDTNVTCVPTVPEFKKKKKTVLNPPSSIPSKKPKSTLSAKQAYTYAKKPAFISEVAKFPNLVLWLCTQLADPKSFLSWRPWLQRCHPGLITAAFTQSTLREQHSAFRLWTACQSRPQIARATSTDNFEGQKISQAQLLGFIELCN